MPPPFTDTIMSATGLGKLNREMKRQEQEAAMKRGRISQRKRGSNIEYCGILSSSPPNNGIPMYDDDQQPLTYQEVVRRVDVHPRLLKIHRGELSLDTLAEFGIPFEMDAEFIKFKQHLTEETLDALYQHSDQLRERGNLQLTLQETRQELERARAERHDDRDHRRRHHHYASEDSASRSPEPRHDHRRRRHDNGSESGVHVHVTQTQNNQPQGPPPPYTPYEQPEPPPQPLAINHNDREIQIRQPREDRDRHVHFEPPQRPVEERLRQADRNARQHAAEFTRERPRQPREYSPERRREVEIRRSYTHVPRREMGRDERDERDRW